MANITAQQAQQELARRELARRQSAEPATDPNEPSTAEKYGRAFVAETVGGTAAALPGLAALGTGLGVTIAGRGRNENSTFLDRLGQNILFDAKGEVRDNINRMQSGMQMGYDLVETDNYKRDISAQEGEEGYLPPDEELFGAVASALIPIGWIGKIGKGTQLGAKAAELASKVPGSGIANRAVELSMPGFTGGAGNAAANVAVQGTITEAGRGFAGEDTVTGIFEPSEPAETTYQAMHDGQKNTGIPAYDNAAEQREEAGSAVGKTLAAGAGATAGMAVATSVLRGRAPKGVKKVLGEIEQGFDDSTAPIERAVTDFAGEDQGAAMRADLDKAVGSASDHHVENAHQFGTLTGDGGVKTQVPYNVMENHYKSQPERYRAKFDAAMDSARKLQMLEEIDMTDAQLAKYKPIMNNLRKTVKSNERDATVGPMMQMWRQWTNDMSTLRHKTGAITEAQHLREIRDGQYYVPSQRIDTDTGSAFSRFVGDLATNANQARGNPKWISRFEQKRRNAAPDGGKVKRDDTDIDRDLNAKTENPFDIGREYSRETIQFTRKNAARVKFVDRMKGSRKITQLKEGDDASTGHVMTIRRNGVDEKYRINDRSLYTALQFRPHFVLPSANFFRKIAQRTATGNWNPAFAPFSLLYDATMGILTASARDGYTGRIDAQLDRALKAAGVKQNARVLTRQMLAGLTRIPDTADAVLAGIAAGANGRMKQMAAINAIRKMQSELTKTGEVSDATRMSTTRTINRFYNTAYGEMVGNGYTSSRFESEPYSGEAFKRLDDLTRKITNTRGYAAYDGVLSTVRDAYRVGLFTRNLALRELGEGRALTAKEKSEVASFVRNAAVDTTRAGENAAWSGFLSSVPYGNVTTRSLVHLTKAMLSDPATASVLTAATGLAAWALEDIMQQLGPEALEEHLMRTPGYDQVSSFPMRVGEEIVNIPIGIELGALVFATSSLYKDWFYDETVLGETVDQGIMGTFMGAAARLIDIQMPPLVDLGYAAITGSRARPGDMLRGEDPFKSELRNQADLQGEQRYYGGDSGLMTDRVQQVLEAGLTVFGQTFADGIEIGIDQRRKIEPDEGFFDALRETVMLVDDAGKEIVNKYAYDTASRYSGLWNGAASFMGREGWKVTPKEGQFTPLSEKVYEVDTALERFKSMYMQQRQGGLGRGTTPYPIGDQLDAIAAMPAALGEDSALLPMVQDAANYFGQRSKSVHRKKINGYRRMLEQFKGSVKGTRSERMEKQNDLNNLIQDEYEVLLDDFGAFERAMQQQYGEDWSLDWLARQVELELSNVRQLAN